MNKKAYYNISDIVMMFIAFAIIGIFIAAGIYIFYSHTIDVRTNEANILYNKLIKSIIFNGNLREEVLSDYKIYQEAGLNSKILNNGEYYFKIEIFENENLIKKIEEGNLGFEVECFLESDKFPQCQSKEFITINNKYKIKILTASNQLGRSI